VWFPGICSGWNGDRFRPLFVRSFVFVNGRKNWQSDRVCFFGDAGELACLPTEWTDVVPGDPFAGGASRRAIGQPRYPVPAGDKHRTPHGHPLS
jgi:hypothetical protein